MHSKIKTFEHSSAPGPSLFLLIFRIKLFTLPSHPQPPPSHFLLYCMCLWGAVISIICLDRGGGAVWRVEDADVGILFTLNNYGCSSWGWGGCEQPLRGSWLFQYDGYCMGGGGGVLVLVGSDWGKVRHLWKSSISCCGCILLEFPISRSTIFESPAFYLASLERIESGVRN